MYLWKCWCDIRAFFLGFLTIAAIVMPVASAVCVGTGLMTDFGAEAFLTSFATIVPMTALLLAAISANERLAQNTLHFLFTKPRRRSYFVWTAFAVGFMEFLTVALANLLSGWITLSRYSKHPFGSNLAQSWHKQSAR
jgi:ABC-type transport system involved in multi-copper enzyme maturation permease subunit